MFDGIKKLQAAADAAKKVGALLERVQEEDANANGIRDIEELKALLAKAVGQGVALHKTLSEIALLIGANVEDLAKELGIDLVALAEGPGSDAPAIA